MVLNTSRQTNINAVFAEGATAVQRRAFTDEYKIQQALWLREKSQTGKPTRGRRRQPRGDKPAAGTSTPVIGCARYMRGYECSNDIMVLTSGRWYSLYRMCRRQPRQRYHLRIG
jgi:hypothetical protein